MKKTINFIWNLQKKWMEKPAVFCTWALGSASENTALGAVLLLPILTVFIIAALIPITLIGFLVATLLAIII